MCSGVFPEAEVDPVIQIASMVQRQGEKEPFIRTVFTLQSCASIVGSQILCFTQEKKLLQVHYISISSKTISPALFTSLIRMCAAQLKDPIPAGSAARCAHITYNTDI